MKKKKLGKTNLEVSEIGLGCWALGGLTMINNIPTTYGDVEEKTACKIIEAAIDLDIDVFDTADVYSLGNCERRLGQALRKVRKSIKILTKAGGIPAHVNSKPYDIDLSHHHLISALDRSLKRLKTDYVDVFQAHAAPSSEDEFTELEKAFTKIKKSGKAIYCGVSIGLKYDVGIELIKSGIVDTLQIYYSLLDFEAEKTILHVAKKYNVGIIVAEPLAQGLLSGKYDVNHVFKQNDVRSTIDQLILKKKLNHCKQFTSLTTKSTQLSQIAIAYVLKNEAVSVCIPGAKSVEQLRTNVEAEKVLLTNAELEKINSIQQNIERSEFKT